MGFYPPSDRDIEVYLTGPAEGLGASDLTEGMYLGNDFWSAFGAKVQKGYFDWLSSANKIESKESLREFLLDHYVKLYLDAEGMGVENLWQSDPVLLTAPETGTIPFAFFTWNLDKNQLWEHESLAKPREISAAALSSAPVDGLVIYHGGPWGEACSARIEYLSLATSSSE